MAGNGAVAAPVRAEEREERRALTAAPRPLFQVQAAGPGGGRVLQRPHLGGGRWERGAQEEIRGERSVRYIRFLYTPVTPVTSAGVAAGTLLRRSLTAGRVFVLP